MKSFAYKDRIAKGKSFAIFKERLGMEGKCINVTRLQRMDSTRFNKVSKAFSLLYTVIETGYAQ